MIKNHPEIYVSGAVQKNADNAWGFLLEKPFKNDPNLSSLILSER